MFTFFKRLFKAKSPKLTLQRIDQTSDEDLLFLIFDDLIKKLPKDYKQEYSFVINTFNLPQRAFFAIWILEAEVKNGGFNQYYYNSSGKYAEIIPEMLREIGAKKLAKLSGKANQLFREHNVNITAEWDGTLEGFSKSYEENPLNALDMEFYSLSEEENLTELEVSYIRKNKIAFC